MANVLELLSNNSLCDLTGNRLWLDDIKQVPGLVASINSYITYNNLQIPALVEYQIWEDGVLLEPVLISHHWTPAGIETSFSCGNLIIKEKKYITREDVFASFLEVKNVGSLPHEYYIKASTLLTHAKLHFRSLYNPNFVEYHNAGTKTIRMRLMLDLVARNVLRQNVVASIVFRSEQYVVDESNDSFVDKFSIAPNKSYNTGIIGSVNHRYSVDQLQTYLEKKSSSYDRSYNDRFCTKWFQENVPSLDCSDGILKKLYYYRYYIIYKNMIQPEVDCFNDLCMYEGKDEFSLVCSASAGMHIREMRWLRDPKYVMSELKTLMASQIKEGTASGRLRDLYVSDLPTAAWETFCLLSQEHKEKVLACRDAIRRYVEWEQSKEYLPDGAVLPIVVGSWRTAAEYQPSFFEFTSPKWDHQQSNPFGNERKTKLHRVDDSVYLCNNLQSVSNFYRVAGDNDTATQFEIRSSQIKANIQSYMWDDDNTFYYDLNPVNLEKALLSKNYAGFLGARVNSSQKKNEALMDHLYHEFAAPYPIPTVATDSPAFAPDNTWRIGPNASEEKPYTYNCCWNGPAWNFANSLVIDTLGAVVQKSAGQKHQKLFAELFNKWCREQCSNENAIPNTCEHYNCFTGEELREIRDYSHSTFIDIVMRRVIGLMENDLGRLICAPIDIGVDNLIISDIPYCGHLITFIWDKSQEYSFQLICDGKNIFSGKELTLVDVEI